MDKRKRKFTYTVLIIVLLVGLFPIRQTKAAQKDFSVEDILLLAAAMELENGCNSDLCILLTGSVILNRVEHPRYPNTIYGVLHQKGQYAEWTLRHLDTVKVSERTMSLALKLIMCGSRDKEIIFQSMHPELGHVKYKVDTDYFATE